LNTSQLNSTQPPTLTSPVNGTQILQVSNVNAVRVHVECKPATSTNQTTDGYFISMTAELGDSCSSYTFTPTPDVYENGTKLQYWGGDLLPVEPSCITAIDPSTQNPSNLNQTQYPVAALLLRNQTAMSAAFCYATYQMYNLTAKLDMSSGRVIAQVLDESLVHGYFYGQDYVFASNGFVHGFQLYNVPVFSY
jgi:hypothetical protein